MTVQPDLASLLDAHMKKASVGDARLASLVNSMTGNPYFIHRSTLRNWRNGSAQRVSNWRQLATVAAALSLDEVQANNLLESGGCPPIRVLAATAQDSDKPLLAYWQDKSLPATRATAATDVDVAAGDTEKNREQTPVVEKDRAEKTFALPGIRQWKVLAAAAVAIVGLLPPGYFYYQYKNLTSTPRNMITNPQFDESIAGWGSYVNDKASADFKVEEGAMRIEVKQTGEKHWHIQFFQQFLEVTAGEIYTLGFRVRGDGATSFKADVTRVANPQTSLGFNDSVRQTISVTDRWSIKTIEFEANQTLKKDDGGAQVLFDIGKSEKGWLMLDDIKFIKGKI